MQYLKFSLSRHLPNIFDVKFRTDVCKAPRQRLFTNKSFFLSMLHLVCDSEKSSTYLALLKAFTIEAGRSFPSKSAFCQLRKKISFHYFKDAFDKICAITCTVTSKWQNLQVVAIDGMQLQLPRTKELISQGFTGRKTSQYSESYLPRGYMVLAFDVLGGFILKHTLNTTLNEIKDALNIIPKFSSKTLFLYDRLYFSKKIVLAHKNHQSYFVARLRRNALKKVRSFFPSKRQFASFKYQGLTLYLIKVKTPKGISVFATNLPRKKFNRSQIKHLYKLRWQVETCFYDLSTTCHLEKWHSKSYNLITRSLSLLSTSRLSEVLLTSCLTPANNLKKFVQYI